MNKSPEPTYCVRIEVEEIVAAHTLKPSQYDQPVSVPCTVNKVVHIVLTGDDVENVAEKAVAMLKMAVNPLVRVMMASEES